MQLYVFVLALSSEIQEVTLVFLVAIKYSKRPLDTISCG